MSESRPKTASPARRPAASGAPARATAARQPPKANPLHGTSYVLNVQYLRQLPEDAEREVAICGRSNAGKSTALNAICGQTKLARTSKTPGRTQHLVYFRSGPGRYLVDLPGYGYAEVPGAVRDHWRGLIDDYLRTREALFGLLLIMDIRHPLKPFDLMMLDYANARGLAAHVLLSKADKLPRGQRAKQLLAVQRELAGRAGVQVLSAPDKLGLDEARAVLADWLQLGGEQAAG
ncbi:MAG: YihA family ribosome biogenesis GTP-binding protein [Xanthomonadales bacterium]|nr:YihA family ribosome biogenesis GTP-binding protein [Xanthomonadales bacterium]